MANENGKVILATLRELDCPATLTEITSIVADRVGAAPREVKQVVKQTLDGGVQYGYVQKQKHKYYAAKSEVDEEWLKRLEEFEEEDDDEEDDEDDEECDDLPSCSPKRGRPRKTQSKCGTKSRSKSRS